MAMHYSRDFKVQTHPATGEVSIYLIETNGSKYKCGRLNGHEIIFDGPEFSYGIVQSEPTPLLTIPRESVSQLIEGLTNLGFAPNSVAMKDGELKATKKHLEDMRALVFEKSETHVGIANDS